MSRLWMSALAFVFAFASHVFAEEPKPRAEDLIKHAPSAPEVLLKALQQKVDFDGSKIGEMTVTEVLQKLATKHDILFVIYEKDFEAKKIDIKAKKSHFKQLDAKEMTIAKFLETWLPSVGATYVIKADYVEIVSLPLKVLVRNQAKEELQPVKKPDAIETILTVLLENEVQLREGSSINDIPLYELLLELSKKHNLTFIINEEPFKADGRPTIKEDKPKLATTAIRGLHVHQFLRVTLESMEATYLIRNNSIEIVSVRHAAKATKSILKYPEVESEHVRLSEPLVSLIVKEKPLNETVAELAKMYDLNVVISTQAGEARKATISARLLNMPADKALDVLALQADLRVVHRGAAFFITSKEHAKEINNEEAEKERQKLEIKKLRESTTPPAPPAKVPEK